MHLNNCHHFACGAVCDITGGVWTWGSNTNAQLGVGKFHSEKLITATIFAETTLEITEKDKLRRKREGGYRSSTSDYGECAGYDARLLAC